MNRTLVTYVLLRVFVMLEVQVASIAGVTKRRTGLYLSKRAVSWWGKAMEGDHWIAQVTTRAQGRGQESRTRSSSVVQTAPGSSHQTTGMLQSRFPVKSLLTSIVHRPRLVPIPHTTSRLVCDRTFAQHHNMAQSCEWLVILPDNANALAKRMEIRP